MLLVRDSFSDGRWAPAGCDDQICFYLLHLCPIFNTRAIILALGNLSRGTASMSARQREGRCFQAEDVAAKSWPWDASNGGEISFFLIQNGWLLMCYSSRCTTGPWTSRIDALRFPLNITCCRMKAQTSTSGNFKVLVIVTTQGCWISYTVTFNHKTGESGFYPPQCAWKRFKKLLIKWRSYDCNAWDLSQAPVPLLPVKYKFAGRFSLSSGATDSFATVCVEGDN